MPSADLEINGASSAATGICSAFTITAYSPGTTTARITGSALSVSLSNNGSARFYSDPYCGVESASLTIADSVAAGGFFARGPFAETVTFVASATQTKESRFSYRAYDPAWGAPTAIESSNAVPSGAFVRVDQSSNVCAAWRQSDGSVDSLYAAYNPSATGWSAPTLVETGSFAVVGNPALAMNQIGKGILAWTQNTAANSAIYYSIYQGSGTWGAPAAMTNGVAAALNPVVAADATGNLSLAWRQDDAGNTNLMSAIYSAATSSFSASVTLDSLTTAPASVASTWEDSGGALTVWMQSDGARLNAYSARWNGSSYLPATSVESLGTNVSSVVAQARLGDRVFAALIQNHNSFDSLFFAAHTPQQGWTEPEVLENSDDPVVGAPAILPDRLGSAFVLWRQGANSISDLKSLRYTGSRWHSLETVDNQSGNVPAFCATTDDVGNVLAAWIQDDGTGSSVNNAFAARYVRDRGWTTPVALDTLSTSVASIRCTANKYGTAVASWEQSDGTASSIYIAIAK